MRFRSNGGKLWNVKRSKSLVFTYATITEIWSILVPRDRKVLKAAIFIQGLLSLLDLLGVALIGSIGALSIYGIQSQESENFANYFPRLMQIEDLTFQAQVVFLSIAAVSVLLLKTVTSLYITRKTLEFVSRRGAMVSGNLLKKVLYKTTQEINTHSRQDLIFAATTGVQYLTTGVIGISVTMLADVALLIVLSAGLIVLNPSLAMTTLMIFVFVGVFLNLYFRNKAFKVGSQETVSHVKSADVMGEVVSTIREALVRDTREHYIQEFIRLRTNVAAAEAKRTFMPFVSKYVMEIAIVLGAFVVAGIQFALFDAKTATAGLAIFFGASSRLAPSVLRIQQSLTQIRIYLGHSENTKKLLFDGNNQRQLKTSPHFDSGSTKVAEEFVPEVLLKDVRFSFSDDDRFELKIDLLQIPPLKQVAIVGASGSGKSTLVDVLLGVLTPNSGLVNISGVTPEIAFKYWPGAVGYVPQSTVIASCSILQNVALGFDPKDVDVLKVKESLHLAGLEEFICEDSSGLYLEVGESGFRLSGGQRQRLGIARALYTQPKLLVLDEATSALDSITESEITNSLNKLRSRVTLVTIAHRLSTVKDADTVIFMDEGKITASGTFEEVRAKVKTFDQQANLLGL
jgi:ATP-binding cassette, subfamily B, bacterial PglK